MNELLFKLVESSLILLVLQIGYKFLFSNSGHFAANRVFLMTALVLSFGLPWIEMPIPVFDGSGQTFLLETIRPFSDFAAVAGNTQQESNSTLTDFGYFLLIVWLFGVLILTMGFFIRMLSIMQLIRNSPVIKRDGVSYKMSDNLPSFSFFNQMVLRPSDIVSKQSFDFITAHELAHMQQRHTLDVILTEIGGILLWFNPLMKLFRKTVVENLEFLADRHALSSVTKDLSGTASYAGEHVLADGELNHDDNPQKNHGIKSAYAQLIVKLASGQQPKNHLHLPIHTFNQSQTKRRLQMLIIKKQRTKAVYLLLIPLLATSLFLHACSANTNDNPASQAEQQTAQKEPDEQQTGPYDQVDQMPEFKGGIQALYTYIGQQIKYPESARNEGITGKTLVEFVVNADGSIGQTTVLRGFDKNCDAESVRVIQGMPDWTPGTKEGVAVPVKMVLPIQFALDE